MSSRKAPRRAEAAAAPRTDSVSHQAHSTPASSLWLQLCAPQSRLLQSIIVISLPLQFTSSSQICPVPLEDQTNKQTVGREKEEYAFFPKESPVDRGCVWGCMVGNEAFGRSSSSAWRAAASSSSPEERAALLRMSPAAGDIAVGCVTTRARPAEVQSCCHSPAEAVKAETTRLNPSILQITPASRVVQPSSQIVPQDPLWKISTRPLLSPPTSRTKLLRPTEEEKITLWVIQA